MNELLDAASARIKAPYFGYVVLAFFALNWRGIFVLYTTIGSPQERLSAFDAETSIITLVLLPLLIGALVAASGPWIKLAFGFLSKHPLERIDLLNLESEHKNTIRKTELEQSRSEFFAGRERELIERAKRDELIQEIEDEHLKSKLMGEIDDLRLRRDEMAENITAWEKTDSLSNIEAEIIKTAARSKNGTIVRNEFLDSRFIQAGDTILGESSAREFLKYDSAMKSLETKGLVQRIGLDGQLFELTLSGWKFADFLDHP